MCLHVRPSPQFHFSQQVVRRLVGHGNAGDGMVPDAIGRRRHTAGRGPNPPQGKPVGKGRWLILFQEQEADSAHEADECRGVTPMQRFAQYQHHEYPEHDKGDRFLRDF